MTQKGEAESERKDAELLALKMEEGVTSEECRRCSETEKARSIFYPRGFLLIP
jgi:hypothetical protein